MILHNFDSKFKRVCWEFMSVNSRWKKIMIRMIIYFYVNNIFCAILSSSRKIQTHENSSKINKKKYYSHKKIYGIFILSFCVNTFAFTQKLQKNFFPFSIHRLLRIVMRFQKLKISSHGGNEKQKKKL